MSSHKLQKYFLKRASTRPLISGRPPSGVVRTAVVIPAYEEAEHLPLTIESLERLPETSLQNTLILVVVNNPPPTSSASAVAAATERVVGNNRRTLLWLQDRARTTPLQLAWIDASTPGRELPAPGGVGLARKIGSDSALTAIRESHQTNGCVFDPYATVLLHLDADTLVQSDYLDAASELVSRGTAGGAIAYEHARADSPTAQRAIDLYELFMRYYVHGLSWAGSPYAFHTVGSTMACTCAGYVQAGGMPAKRQAGEDFYFLQQLAKVGGVCSLGRTTVFPSPRVSDRVPFGTGPRMADALQGGNDEFTAYDARVFGEVRRIVETVQATPGVLADDVLAAVSAPESAEFLVTKGIGQTFSRLRKQHADHERFVQAFHQWFDGLATYRLVHCLSETRWPCKPLLEAWGELLEASACTVPKARDAAALLAWCRSEGPAGVGA